MNLFPRSLAGRTAFALGAFALCMGGYGLINPPAQIRMMGFAPLAVRGAADYTGTLMSIVGFATLNTAVLYLVGSIKNWPGFFGLAIWTRLVMGTGLMLLYINGQAPNTFVGAAIWEWVGAGLIAGAWAWDSRRQRNRKG
ncbi:hypothetical protein [Pseudomonas gingeri]|uniref:hypothetical protein n=1 Tax=Pseudomonas gingeri TaxID=117681 RepID=UPI00159F9AAA|nr:hypothetical protein [Pseudomonas gingeri]NWE28042.1 hypothetical protein [Pseudomonas gingeri]NWE94061.1 hypothetical protein [Pseudomonas gingeri]